MSRFPVGTPVVSPEFGHGVIVENRQYSAKIKFECGVLACWGYHTPVYTKLVWDMDRDFVLDRNAVNSRSSLQAFLARWRTLFPSLNIDPEKIDLENFIRFRDDATYQNKHMFEYPEFCDMVLPVELLEAYLIARKYDLPTFTAFDLYRGIDELRAFLVSMYENFTMSMYG